MKLVRCYNDDGETLPDNAYGLQDARDGLKVGSGCGETGAGGYGHCVADEQEGYFDAVFCYAEIFPERSSEAWYFWYEQTVSLDVDAGPQIISSPRPSFMLDLLNEASRSWRKQSKSCIE